MKKPDITAGDWIITGELDTLAVIAESDDPRACDGQTQICQVKCGDYEITHYETPARNAQAIAALPKLLEALEDFNTWLICPDTSKETLEIMSAKARTALLAAGYTE